MSRRMTLALVVALFAVGVSLVYFRPVAPDAGPQPVGPTTAVGTPETPTVTRTATTGGGVEAHPGSGKLAFRPDPQPITENTRRGLAYLVSQQQANGGWGQGGGWRNGEQGRVEGNDVADPTDVGNTCIATLALIRAGNTPTSGEYAKQLAKGVEFICQHVEKSDAKSLYVTDVRSTQLQSKIGAYVDTFLTALVLSELKGIVPAEKADQRMVAALDKTIGKIEANQGADGKFAGNAGWASTLSVSLGSKALNRAVQAGAKVDARTLERDFNDSLASLDVPAGAAGAASPAVSERVAELKRGRGVAAGGVGEGAGGSDAGVVLYREAAVNSRIQEQAAGQAVVKAEAERVLADVAAPEESKARAKTQLAAANEVLEANEIAVSALTARLDDKQFLAGFGNNGGEEFLSYMNISETMLAKGGKDWERWNKSISDAVHQAQNQDGSWSGHHCITGRTFCTAAALLTLMADRAPVSFTAELKKAK